MRIRGSSADNGILLAIVAIVGLIGLKLEQLSYSGCQSLNALWRKAKTRSTDDPKRSNDQELVKTAQQTCHSRRISIETSSRWTGEKQGCRVLWCTKTRTYQTYLPLSPLKPTTISTPIASNCAIRLKIEALQWVES